VTRSDPDAARAWRLLLRFFLAQRTQLPSAAEVDLSPVQCHVLHLLEPGQPLPMRRLAERLCCDASNVTGLVDRLEARGLVERRPSAEDRRVKVLHLTSHGSRLRTDLTRCVAGRPHPFARLSPQDQRTLVRLLERLVEE
jgi:DNA-binding MarR family transcriptional regulator